MYKYKCILLPNKREISQHILNAQKPFIKFWVLVFFLQPSTWKHILEARTCTTTSFLFYGIGKSDHLEQGDIMFRKGQEEDVFGINPDGSKIPTDRVPKDATVHKQKKWKLPIPYVIEKSLGKTVASNTD